MALHFVDEADNHGWINSDLEVDYDGPVNVNMYIKELFDDERPFEDVAEEMIIDMPHDLAIVEIRQEELPSHAFSS